MLEEKYDFYSPANLKIYNLNKAMKGKLSCMDNLDHLTRVHSENVANLSCRIAEYLKGSEKFIFHCTMSGYIHDIGKLYIPKEITQKPGKLTAEEYEIMKKHTTLGYEFCMKDLYLRPFADGPYYHHESLDGTGYPQGLTKKDIPYTAQIIRVADEYDALVTERHYTTHVNISETLKLLVKETQPTPSQIALDYLKENERGGKINSRPLKALFKVVIDDILYEISGIQNYVKYLKDEIKRLELVVKYGEKMDHANKDKTKEYYKEGMRLMFSQNENFDNFMTILDEYREALNFRLKRIDDLYEEIRIIKKLKV